jgi:hypothetical protein
MTNTHEARQEWWEKPGRMEDLEQRFKPDGLLRLARSTPEYYDSHGHYLPGLAVLALTYHADLVEARAVAERTREALRAAREGIVALHQAGWDNLRRDIATEALRTIDDFLAAVPDPEEDAT